MNTKSMSWALALLTGIFATALPTSAEAANTLARVVSRANCLVPVPKLSLIEANGYTFNESISWDPFNWNHYAITRSHHMRSVFWGGFWSDYLVLSQEAGSFNTPAWRVWAGKIDKGDSRELPNPHYRPVRFVYGDHLEILDGMRYPYNRQTSAVGCNLTQW